MKRPAGIPSTTTCENLLAARRTCRPMTSLISRFFGCLVMLVTLSACGGSGGSSPPVSRQFGRRHNRGERPYHLDGATGAILGQVNFAPVLAQTELNSPTRPSHSVRTVQRMLERARRAIFRRGAAGSERSGAVDDARSDLFSGLECDDPATGRRQGLVAGAVFRSTSPAAGRPSEKHWVRHHGGAPSEVRGRSTVGIRC
jgi:hypothetical protein